MTECCSCQTQRSQDADLVMAVKHEDTHAVKHQDTHARVLTRGRKQAVASKRPWTNTKQWVDFSSEASGCLAAQTQVSNGVAYCGGTFVWTLHDYGGEPGSWPHVSSSFGSFDFAGFPKQAAWWFRSWWLGNVSAADPARPPLPLSTFCKLVESWVDSPNGTRTLHVYTNAAMAGVSVSAGVNRSPVHVPAFGAAVFYAVPFVPGSVIATCYAPDGVTVLARDTVHSAGVPAKLVLTVDAPTPRTGTGEALYLDGSDVAVLRATIVDAEGHICPDASDEVYFAVSQGPGIVIGVGNGDPADQQVTVASRAAYHGLVRGVVRVTVDAAGSDAERALRAFVNLDAGKNESSRIWLNTPQTGGESKHINGSATASEAPPDAITVIATAGKLESATVTIALSTDPKHSVLISAAASVGLADLGG